MAAIITRRKWTRQPAALLVPAVSGPSVGIWYPDTNAVTGVPITYGGTGNTPYRKDTRSGIGLYTNGKWAQTDIPMTAFSVLTWLAIITPDAAPSTADYSSFFQTAQTTFNWDHNSSTYNGSFSVSAGGSFAPCKFTNGFTAGQEVVLAGTWDGSTTRIYRAGVLENSAAKSGTPTTPTNSLQFIGGTGNTAPWAGSCSLFYWDQTHAAALGEIEALSDNPWGVLFRPRTRRLYFGAAAGGTIYGVSVAEALAFLDASSAAAVLAPSLAESLALADAPSAVMTTAAAVAESLALTDSDVAAMVAAASAAESLALTDAASASAVFAASAAESTAMVDAPSATAVMGVTVTEVAAVADAQNTGGQMFAVSANELLGLSDAYSATVIFAGTLQESISLVDAPSSAAIWNAVVAEAAALSDLPSAAATMGVTITEVAGFADAQSAATPSTLTTDQLYVAGTIGRRFIVQIAGRTFVVSARGRKFTVQ